MLKNSKLFKIKKKAFGVSLTLSERPPFCQLHADWWRNIHDIIIFLIFHKMITKIFSLNNITLSYKLHVLMLNQGIVTCFKVHDTIIIEKCKYHSVTIINVKRVH